MLPPGGCSCLPGNLLMTPQLHTHQALSRVTQLQDTHFLKCARYNILLFKILIEIYVCVCVYLLKGNESKFHRNLPQQVLLYLIFFKYECKIFYHNGLTFISLITSEFEHLFTCFCEFKSLSPCSRNLTDALSHL